jgi:hypothetical protein
MTIDERIENLTVTVERIAQESEKRGKDLDRRIEGLLTSVELLEKAQQRTAKEIKSLGRYIRAIVLDHDYRLWKLEGGLDDDPDLEPK